MGGDDPLGTQVDRAVGWALARRGAPGYATRCLAFVEDAFERANGIEIFGGADAAESAALYGTVPLGKEPPPIGALVFYACSGPINGVTRAWGHVGISLGDGRVVHAWDEVRVDRIEQVEHLEQGNGWSRPALVGWTPPSRVLATQRARDWAHG